MSELPQIREIVVNDYITEIENLIKNKNYLSALSISLMMPDICSKFQNKNGNDKEKYIEWFNEYVYESYYKGLLSNEIECNGNVCYALRNSMLHKGNPYIEFLGKSKKADKVKAKNDGIQLCVNGNSSIERQYGEAVTKYRNQNYIHITIRINIVNFSRNMINGCKNFLRKNKNISNTSIFYLIDWDKKGGEIKFTPK